MDNIPTAEEFIQEYLDVDADFMESMREQMSKMRGFDFDNLPDLMNEYAILKSKFYVEVALKAAAEKALVHVQYQGEHNESEKAPIHIDPDFIAKVDKDSILNAYPLTNIK